MRNPLLTDGQKIKPLSHWKREYYGLIFEKNDVNYKILDMNLELKCELKNIQTLPRKDYMRHYMKRRRTTPLPGIKVSELARIKKVNRSTILRHLNKFDIISRSPITLIKFDSKIFNWNPINHSFKRGFRNG